MRSDYTSLLKTTWENNFKKYHLLDPNGGLLIMAMFLNIDGIINYNVI